MGLPNVYDYIHKHRERLMEEKRQKLLAMESQRNANIQVNDINNNNVIIGPVGQNEEEDQMEQMAE